MIYQNRLARARAEMKNQDVDVLILTHTTDLRFLTGATGHAMERLSALFLTAGDAFFVGPGFELGSLDPAARELLECHGWDDGQDPFALVQRLLDSGASRRAAVGREVPSWVLLELQSRFPQWIWKSADGLMTGLRAVKDEAEYRALKEANTLSAQALLRLLDRGLAGLTELQAHKILEEYCAGEGAVGNCFSVASGPNSALPHHSSGDRVIQKGDVVVIDFGGYVHSLGYQADTTRTFAVGSMPDGLQEIYDIVLAANEAAFAAARPGAVCQEVDRAAREIITKAGYGECFTHRLGHGIGLDVHEHPYLTEGNRQLLVAGNVVTDEPGIYLPGRFGVRIEDSLIIRENGGERLTPLDHKLRVVE